MNKKIDDSFIEAFSGLFCRIIVTADDVETLCRAASDATATPSVVIGRTEGGVERYLSSEETPDSRVGALLQLWGELNPKKTFTESLRNLKELIPYPPRADIGVKPFTAVYDALPDAEGKWI